MYQIQEEEPKYQRLYEFFRKIAFLAIPDEKKKELSVRIANESKGDRLYWIELFLSVIIATFGLLQNSVAVIIGAMVIAPLLKPIQGMAFGISSGQAKNFWHALKLLLMSTLISIFLSWLFSMAVPLRIETAEILARTAPNLLDFFIAVASGTVAILALSFSRLSESVAGVAMAAALLPPLAVVGIELSFGNYDLAISSFLLYLTNILAILLVGTMIFFFYGFVPHQKENQKRLFERLFVLFGMIAAISFPLVSSLTLIAEKIDVQREAQSFIELSLANATPSATVSRIDVTQIDSESVDLFGVIKIPEGAEFFEETRSTLRKDLANVLKKDVSFEIEILRTASIVSREEYAMESAVPESQILKDNFQSLMDQMLPSATILNTEVNEINEEDESRWAIKTAFSLQVGEDFSEEIREEIENAFDLLNPGENISYFWVFLPQQAPMAMDEPSAREILLEELELKWEDYFQTILPSGANIDGLEISWTTSADDINEDFSKENISRYKVKLDLYLPDSKDSTIADLRAEIQKFSMDNFDQPVEVKMRVFNFGQEAISSFRTFPSLFNADVSGANTRQ